uniref:Uncharacterized protein n=1 Tax=Chromera velia CCMP2878 TaxID=1169474 RepID=A0A0G4GK36_9ALVE|eukprot:Cvel_22251.t1-p1 / transcript=Cvel_22251.t1 / gene=Cvel_22251 / organism=Chromera_velia_CCMP2878 / gene_product=hypothetical protein / transcript_product=hypothetical protein / location=Cvel_scaffold2168:1821-5162(+) / protein_length=274 / sequence_SO=supercontig / SO=protein_coding / is_pseudo=false
MTARYQSKRKWSGVQKVGSGDKGKTAKQIADARMYGIRGRDDFRYHLSPKKDFGTPWINVWKRGSVRIYVTDILPSETPGYETENDWMVALFVVEWCRTTILKLDRPFEKTPVRGSFLSRISPQKEEIDTLHKLVYVFGPGWRLKLADRFGYWLEVLPLLWAQVCGRCFRCGGEFTKCGGATRCSWFDYLGHCGGSLSLRLLARVLLHSVLRESGEGLQARLSGLRKDHRDSQTPQLAEGFLSTLSSTYVFFTAGSTGCAARRHFAAHSFPPSF